MFEDDIHHLQAILQRIATLQVNSSEKQENKRQVYEGLVQAIAALEQLNAPMPSLSAPTEPVADLYEAITQEERLKQWL
jgi:hypothetical protein